MTDHEHSEHITRHGALILNLGSPAAPTPQALRRYLRRFLNDPRVVDVPSPLRGLLVGGVIAPLRAWRSARRYRNIWTALGSPLDLYTAAQSRGLGTRLPGTTVAHAMCYGEPSIESVIREFARQSITDIVLVPLYPQYASASVGATLAEVYRCVSALPFVPTLKVVRPFFADEGYLDATAARIRASLADFDADHLVLSYHGLPVRQLRAATRITGGRCELGECCATLRADNHACYRAQCLATSRLLTERLPKLPISTVFQSRISGSRWSGPHLEDEIVELARRGVRRAAVACPGFVADNLETLHDVAIDARQAFLAAGGEALLAVPCVNDDRRWLDVLAGMIRREQGVRAAAPIPEAEAEAEPALVAEVLKL